MLWIRIRTNSAFNLGGWIRIRIQEGQHDPEKWSKIKFWCASCSLLRDEDFFCSLDVLYGGLGISKLQFLIKKFLIFFSCKFCQIFGHENPGSASGSGSGSRSWSGSASTKNAGSRSVSGSALKSMRIHNTAWYATGKAIHRWVNNSRHGTLKPARFY